MTSFRVKVEPVGVHAQLSVFGGVDADHRALLGYLLMTPTEAEEFVRRIADHQGEEDPDGSH